MKLEQRRAFFEMFRMIFALLLFTEWAFADEALREAEQEDVVVPPVERTVTAERASDPVADKPDCSKGFLGLRTLPPECEGARTLEYAFLPAIFTQKETGLGFAVYNELSFFTDDAPETKSSRTGLALTLTTRKQFIARVPTFINFQNNDWMIEGFADFRIYPNRYYGTGNDSNWDYQGYTEDVLSFDYEFRRRVWDSFYVGLLWNLRAAFRMEKTEYREKSGEEITEPIPEDSNAVFQPYVNQGFGLQAAYDSRDDFQYPLRGGYHRTSLELFSKAFGSDFNYLFWTVDARQYVPTFPDQVLALQFLSEVRNGTMNFPNMAELGGPALMRGYYRGRYRANNILLFQAEYRFPIYKRLTGVGFGNLGEVYGRSSPFRFDAIRWTAGAGLRFRFGAHTYIRFDLGGNQETYAAIFNGGQAF